MVKSQGAGSRAGYILDCKLKVERVWLGDGMGWDGGRGAQEAELHKPMKLARRLLQPGRPGIGLGPC